MVLSTSAHNLVTNLDPMNRGLKLGRAGPNPDEDGQVTNLDPMNRGLKLNSAMSRYLPLWGYKPRPDE